MLNEAVEIHYQVNYKDLQEEEERGLMEVNQMLESMDDMKDDQVPPLPKLNKEQDQENQINSCSKKLEQSDFQAQCLQILNYVQVKLVCFWQHTKNGDIVPS